MASKTIVLITGANRGIGYTLAQTLARDYGFHILLGSRSTASGSTAVATLQNEGLSVESLAIDLEFNESIERAAKEVERKYGRLDVLVNNAAIGIDDTFTGDVNDIRRLYQETFNTNLFGTATVTGAFIPLLEKSYLPRIVFLTSSLGSLAERANSESAYHEVGWESYRCSKAALNMLCLNYWKKYECKPKWKINAACPGFVVTKLNKGGGVISTEEAMPNLVRLCTLGMDGESGTFTNANGVVRW
ncbi:NAD(P)-binding protein [Lindgomyces ingoldianus]|uniref:NAD(P)-binding protein n=1 Tax=Lindgomyces ingoldianus TaxID=673940 RepID=A0ACB6QJD0_9PLEO|nr:NAD(P)-binding protein [Lindgomyces ingoldianus]KAF2466615.1 NAD(P)-binding protein [Lindgomyces ingoldianus]